MISAPELGKPNAIFLCTGNSARSQMAEGFLRTYAGDHYNAYSAGLTPKAINPYAVQAMQERGIDISLQRSSDITEYMGHLHFATIVTVCDHAEKNCPRTFLLGADNHLHWGLEDPAAFEGSESETAAKFREIRDQLDALIRQWLADEDVPVNELPA